MDPRPAPEFILDAFADPNSVRDVVRGILHTIFFHRYFPSLGPQTRDVLDLTLPYVGEPGLETMIDQRTTTFMHQLDAERRQQRQANAGIAHDDLDFDGLERELRHGGQAAVAAMKANAGRSSGGRGRGQITVQFFEKKRRKAWLMRGEEDVCWECWTIKVTVAEPRTESERAKVRKATESTLLNTIMKIVTAVNSHKEHIPPITTTEVNPFPYQIIVNQKEGGWATRMGIY